VLPAYDVGGDLFDYAGNPDSLWLAVVDAMGRGNRAAAVATLSLGALRSVRRRDARGHRRRELRDRGARSLGRRHGPAQLDLLRASRALLVAPDGPGKATNDRKLEREGDPDVAEGHARDALDSAETR
jgi:hypothetical protein